MRAPTGTRLLFPQRCRGAHRARYRNLRKISDSLICFLFFRQIAQNRLLGEQRRRAARVPEHHRFARRNPPLADVADQPLSLIHI